VQIKKRSYSILRNKRREKSLINHIEIM
jgi:hypothetical protein